MKKKILLNILFVFIFCLTKASVTDTIKKDSTSNINSFYCGLDSLENLWFVRKSEQITNNKQQTVSIKNKAEIVKLSEKDYNKRISFIKTPIKLVFNDKVKKYIELYVDKKHKQTEILLGLAKIYNPIFEKAIKEKKLPEEFKYLPIAESSLFNNTISESGATGYWQLSYSIAKLQGINITSYIDERKDILISSQAATNYLKELYKIYNDWLLSIAAYNSTPAIVNKAIRRAKGRLDFWSIYDYLPKENRDFVPGLIAVIYVMNYYKEHDLKPLEIVIPGQTDTVKIYKQLHLKQVSYVLKLALNELKEMNPVFKEDIIPEKIEGYNLILPNGYSEIFYKNKDSIYKYTDSSLVHFMKLPDTYYDNILKDEKAEKELIYYIVKSKDNLSRIAYKYGVTTNEIKKWNHLKGNTVKKGQKLKIYYLTYKPKKPAVSNQLPAKPESTENKQTEETGEYIIYKVKLGDSFSQIAKNYGVSVKNILELNNLEENKIIKPGDIIKIKKKN